MLAGASRAVADAVAEADVEPRERDGGRSDRRGEDRRQQSQRDDQQPARAPVAAPGVVRPEDHEPGEEDEHPAGAGRRPERGLGDQGDQRRTCETEADERPRPVAPLGDHLLGDRPLAALLGHDEQRGEVDQDPGAAEQRQDHEPESEEHRVQVEVPAEAAGDTGDDAVGGALEALDVRGMCDVFAHVSRVPTGRPDGYPDSPWSDPQRYFGGLWERSSSPRTAGRATTTT